MKYYLYILKTLDNTYYCGIARDVLNRFEKHKNGTGAKYTRAHKPDYIAYVDIFEDKSSAMKEEYRIKQLKRKEKEGEKTKSAGGGGEEKWERKK